MTNTAIEAPTKALLEGPGGVEKPADSHVAEVAKNYGVSPLRQTKDIFSMRFGSQKLGANEYYDLRVFDPAYDKKAKRAFLGQGGMNALNLEMNPDTLMDKKNFIGNKLMYTDHLRKSCIPTTETQAFVLAGYNKDPNFVLSDVEAIVAFMRDKAQYPLFGKPMGGSLSVGSVKIDGMSEGQLMLGNGSRVPLEAFAKDVLEQYKDGYLLQTDLKPHQDMQGIIGDAIGSIRVVTVNDGSGLKPAYAVWKIPSPAAMSDNYWQDGSMLGLINISDGTVLNCHRGKGPSAELLEKHPQSQQSVVGFQVPHWTSVIENAIAAHELFPEFGIFGFDIAITEDGPVIMECNDKPNHMVYQYPARRGIQNQDLKPIWDSVIDRLKKVA